MSAIYVDVAIAGGVILATSFFFNFMLRIIVPSIEAEYSKPNTIFRSFGDPRMLYMHVHPFVCAALLYFMRSLIPVARFNNDELALLLWVLGPLPGICVDYACYRISFKLALSWWCVSAVQLLAGARIMTLRGTA